MNSRRDFFKKASAFASALALPTIGTAKAKNPIATLDFSTATTDDELFALVRKQLLIPEGRIYLNTASLGSCPLSVLDAVNAATRQLEANPVSENWGALGVQMDNVRGKIAGFINANRDEILLTRNATEGLGLITQSLNLQAGDEILTTTQEHSGAYVGMDFVAKTKGVIVKKVPLPFLVTNKQDVISSVLNGITPKTKMVVLSHVNTITGLVMPFTEIASQTKSKGIILVSDGAQALGMMRVDVAELGVDAYAACGHKWLLAPKETGFVYIKSSLQPKIHGLFNFSGYGAYSESSGTRNVTTIIGMGTAIDFQRQIGIERIQKRCVEIQNYCLAGLKKLKGVTIISPEREELSSGIVSFTLEKANNQEVNAKLKAQDIIVKVLPGSNSLRIACHIFISKSEIDIFINALSRCL